MLGDDIIFDKKTSDNGNMDKPKKDDPLMMKYANLELEHIKLELQNKRFHHLRHFIDAYYCYSKGFISKSGMANWNAIMWNKDYISEGAELIKNNLTLSVKEKNKSVTRDHAVPIREIKEKLKNYADTAGVGINIKGIADILDTNTFSVTITFDEDQKLNSAKLKQKMPPNYYQPSHVLFDDHLARYKEVGIKTSPLP